MVLPWQRLRGVESDRSNLVDSWEAYVFFYAALFRFLMVSQYPSWLRKEYSNVCSTLTPSSSSIQARLPAP